MSSTELIDPERMTPEGLLVAQTYLTNGGDMLDTAEELNMPPEEVESMLKKREVREFVDRVYHESGFRNRFKIAKVMDELIAAKLEEMDETGLGSSKDIAELIAQQHKMKMEELKMEMQIIERQEKIIQQNNIQNNIHLGDDDSKGGYNKFLDKLMGGND